MTEQQKCAMRIHTIVLMLISLEKPTEIIISFKGIVVIFEHAAIFIHFSRTAAFIINIYK